MRGRFSPAIWLFAALACGLLAVGARAPQPRLSPAAQAARQRLLDRAGLPAPQDTRLCPERGCLLDRSTGAIYRRDESGEWAAHGSSSEEPALGVCVVVAPACDAADPGARDYALAELCAALRTQWQTQVADDAGGLQSSHGRRTVGFNSPFPRSGERGYGDNAVSLYAESQWLAPDWSVRLSEVAEELWQTLAREWETWAEFVSRLTPPEPDVELAPAAQLAPDSWEFAEREERSVLVRRTPTIAAGEVAFEAQSERDEQSILIRR